MKNTLESRLGLFFALAMVVAVVVLELIGASDFFRKGYRVQAAFSNVQELKEGDQVKLAGVQVGYVEDIALEGGKASVTMKIQQRYEIKTDSRAVIRFVGLMGQNYIAIEGGTDEGSTALPGATLTTYEQPDLSALMAKLEGVAGSVEGLTKSISPESFSSLFGPITDFMKQNSGELSAIIGNMRTVSDNIAQGKGTVGKLIADDTFYNSAYGTVTNLQVASADLQGMLTKVDSLLSEARATIDQVNAGKGTVGKLVTDETLYTEATTAMTNLREILQKINSGQGSIGELVNDNTLLKNAKFGLQKIEKATEGIEDQGPLSIIGIAISPLF
jgi:phospholipid/cholesterol/gamma-HCH transport system substrate-binding protein